MLTGGVRVVGFIQDVVGILFYGEACPGPLKPEAAVDLAAEVFAGQQVVFGVFVFDAVVAPLPVHRFQCAGNPAHAALYRHELQIGEAVADAGEDEVGDAVHVVYEDARRYLGEVGFPAFVALVLEHRADVAAADVEAHRCARLLGCRPDGIPMAVGEGR